MSFVGQRISDSFHKLQAKLRLPLQREVPPEISKRQMEEEMPFSWKKDEALYGYVSRFMLKGSAQALLRLHTLPFGDRIWGATPIEDLAKYKDLYTFTPYIKAAVDVTVNLASATGSNWTPQTKLSANG
jgi:hypothetical protein